MTLIEECRQSLCDSLVRLAPTAFLDSLCRQRDLVTRELGASSANSRNIARFARPPREFEDLAPLFPITPLGPGIIRLDLDEAAALFRSVQAFASPRGVEIGRFRGGSTLLLAVAVGAGGQLLSIDINPPDDRTLEQVLGRANVRSRVELLVGDAAWIDREDTYDFAFIDGDRTYEGARRDHQRWGAKVRVGGLIIHHGMAGSRAFAHTTPELARLRTHILKRQGGQVELLEEAGALSIFRRVGPAWPEV